jgi:DNA-binding NarL/FixJ family response regulator
MHILIAEDHDLILEGLKVVLRRLDADVAVRACGTFADALEAAKQDDFDLVLLDRDLPGMNGVAGVEVFRAYFPAPRIVVLADQVRRPDVLEAIRHGAAGFLPKSLGTEALLSAVRLVLSGERYVPAELLSAEVLPRSGRESPGGAEDDPFQRLSGREADVLERLLDGLTNKEIGRALDVQEITVKLHLRSVYRKLGVKNRAQAVGRTLSSGWRR